MHTYPRWFVFGAMAWMIHLSAGTSYPASAGEPLVLAEGDAVHYTVVLSAKASASEKWAADELVDHVEQICGGKMAIVADTDPTPERCIILGDGDAARAMGVFVEREDLGPDGFVIRTVGKRIVIAGSRQRGTMYGVFELLERLGCRWWYPGESSVPKRSPLTIEPVNDRQVPALEYRDFLYGEQDSSKAAQIWRARNRVNGGFHKTTAAKYGGSWTFYQLVHSYTALLPPAEYFEEHPEYYALVRDKRNTGQVCFSNDEVVPLVAAAVNGIIEEHPEYKHITVGQNDNNNYCRCDECKALAEKYKSAGGAQLDFAKRVATIVRQDHPDAIINVPAYRWSRKAPKEISPDEKMSIALCSIECNFGQPLAEGYPAENASFKDDIVGWSKIAPKLLIWDYTTNFSHYILPYPNYYVLAENVKFYVDHKAAGIMHQGSHTTPNGQLAPLTMWVLAKAMWNPDASSRELAREFCLGYYGPDAGKYMLEYLDLLHGAIAADRMPIWCTRRTYLNAPYLSPETIAQAEKLFAQAEAAAAEDPDRLGRVQIAHLPVQYVMLKRPRQLWGPAKTMNGHLDFAAYCEQFAAVAREAEITRMAEGDSAAQLYGWAIDYGRLRENNPKADLPEELVTADPSSYHFLQAAQLDQKVRFLVKAEGATDGWAQNVVSHGWSIQHHLAPPFDMTPERKYKMFIRVRATAVAGASGPIFAAGLHVTGGKRTSRAIRAEEVDGTWQTYEIGELTATDDGGGFYIALDSKGKAKVANVQLDCLWLEEVQ